MAQIGLIETFTASHGKNLHEHNFKVEVVLEGSINERGYAGGVDHYKVLEKLKQITKELENKNLKEFLTSQGYKSSGNESIASYFLKNLTEFPIKFVKIWETPNRYAVVYANEI